MIVEDIQSRINDYSSRTETLFLTLAEKFPLLLNKQENSSMDSLLQMFKSLDELNRANTTEENQFFANYGDKYNNLFDSLNAKIEDLSKVNDQVKKIKDNSEEMELIALNAMVISIKSGEKGRAFSSVTESLKQLSSDMNVYSNKLLEEEQELLDYIKSLKTIFDQILDAQHQLSQAGTSSSSTVTDLITKASDPLNEIKEVIGAVYHPIQKAMEGLQLQDIIRQAMDHVKLCLNECSTIDPSQPQDHTMLDTITFNITLLQLSKSVLADINENIAKSIEIFSDNWTNVSVTLDKVEPKRQEYIRRFLDKKSHSPENIHDNMDKIINHFTQISNLFNTYQSQQKTLERNCNGITNKAHTMYAVFEGLKPIIDRLHHVRILQQIEVAKNPAIIAVKDSVTDMDILIQQANESLDEMQDLLSAFISQIGELLNQFQQAIISDNGSMNKIRLAKNAFFNEFKNVQEGVSSILSSFTVFPAGFEQHCITVDNKLNDINSIHYELDEIIKSIEEECEKLNRKKDSLMQHLGIDDWEIKDSRLKELVTHFTIAAHKESAGAIGNFEIEKGTPAGEITFF
ncbi:MAG: hypothetical protein MJ169_03400 [Treponema sp.]|nr:hypothetical protein [Treponema sp.]